MSQGCTGRHDTETQRYFLGMYKSRDTKLRTWRFRDEEIGEEVRNNGTCNQIYMFQSNPSLWGVRIGPSFTKKASIHYYHRVSAHLGESLIQINGDVVLDSDADGAANRDRQPALHLTVMLAAPGRLWSCRQSLIVRVRDQSEMCMRTCAARARAPCIHANLYTITNTIALTQ